MSHLSGDRYSRQILLPFVGAEGQKKLQAARVGLVGCGALGSTIANQLVRAGVGYLRVADRDYPELHNLQRQALYTEDDVRRRLHKAEAAAAHLREINSEVVVEPHVVTIDEHSLPSFAKDIDLIIDGTDNFATRFLINDYAVNHSVPWIYGGVVISSGMTMTIVPGSDGPCLRCLMRHLPPPELAPTADTVGVLSGVVAVVANIEATEAMKLILEPEARNRHLLVIDLWDLTFETIDVHRDPTCVCCGTETEVSEA